MARHHYETLQQVFDDAYRGLAAQGFKRSMKAGNCAYRGNHGLRCAIGHCIPDEIIPSEVELASLLEENPQVRRIFSGVPKLALGRLQYEHDNADSDHDMKLRLSSFAERYGLTIPSIGEAA